MTSVSVYDVVEEAVGAKDSAATGNIGSVSNAPAARPINTRRFI
jgi:hypothetical protein